jgi:hypothetical protein
MAEDDDVGLPPVRAGSLLSDDELDLLSLLAGEHNLHLDDITQLIEKERAVQGMGRRHGIHMFIRQHISEVASRRLKDQT